VNERYGKNPLLWNAGLLIFNVAALGVVVPVVQGLWNLGLDFPKFVSVVLGLAGGSVYCFLVLLFNKFLIQNRVDRLPLKISRWSFAVGCAVVLAMSMFLAVTENACSRIELPPVSPGRAEKFEEGRLMSDVGVGSVSRLCRAIRYDRRSRSAGTSRLWRHESAMHSHTGRPRVAPTASPGADLSSTAGR
jgi:hypothetical protein